MFSISEPPRAPNMQVPRSPRISCQIRLLLYIRRREMESDDELAAITIEDSDDEEESYGGGDADDSDYLSSSHHNQYGCRSQNYTILNEDDIRECQDDTITKISTVLSISRDAAGVLLRHYNWNVSEVHDKWFADEEKVRKTVGLLESHVPLPDDKELTCGICFETYPRDRMSATDCGHPFCVICWQGYIDTAINDGPGCLMLRCPDPSCGAAVGQEMVNKIASNEGREKYNRYFLRSFVDDNRKAKWCPAPGCDYAVSFSVGGGTYDVSCRCSHSFCWNCVEEAHRPVDCGTVSKWIMKNSAESGNMNWLCLDAWSEHGQGTGGFSTCNRYEAAKRGGYDDAKKRRDMAKNSLERYTHYYERWATNQSSMQRAVENINQLQTVHLKKLRDKQRQPVSQLKFSIEAWLQIVECRRVLKWTYAYGYYLPEQEHAKKQFFEYLQGEAESGLERLHQCAEKEFQGFLNSEGPSNDFHEFRTKLEGLTSVTKNYFENLVRALENGLFDVDSHAPS